MVSFHLLVLPQERPLLYRDRSAQILQLLEGRYLDQLQALAHLMEQLIAQLPFVELTHLEQVLLEYWQTFDHRQCLLEDLSLIHI